MKYFFILLAAYAPFLKAAAQQGGDHKMSQGERIEWAYHELIVLRSGYFNLPADTCNIKYRKLMLSLNTIFDEIYRKQNYPGYNALSRSASDHLFILLENYKGQNDRRKQLLKLLYDQVVRKNESPENYSKLTDRISYDESKKQVYGTLIRVNDIAYNIKDGDVELIIYPIIDSVNVDKRRSSISLPPLSAYIKTMKHRLSTDLKQ